MSFEQFALSYGVLVGNIQPSNRVQRIPTVNKPHSKNGAAFWDGFKGWVSDWAQGGELHWFDNPQAKTWNEADRKAWAQRKQAAERRIAEGWARAASQADVMLRDTELKNHDYLQYKGLHGVLGLVNEANELLIPMRNWETNALQGVQVVRYLPDERKYEKKMLPGMRAKGCVLRLGPKRTQELILCEGYATGLSIDAAVRLMRLSMAVLVCFSDSNMVYVASLLKSKAFVYADNDFSGAGQRAAEKTGLQWCMSEETGNDANDDQKQFGLMYVAELIKELRFRRQV